MQQNEQPEVPGALAMTDQPAGAVKPPFREVAVQVLPKKKVEDFQDLPLIFSAMVPGPGRGGKGAGVPVPDGSRGPGRPGRQPSKAALPPGRVAGGL